MKAIIIKPNSKKELQFLSDLLQKLGVSAKEISEEELEDQGMTLLMKDVDRGHKVDKESIMKKLQSK